MRIETIKEIIQRHKPEMADRYHISEIGIFGSFTRGDQRENSDIDIYVEMKKEYKTYDNFMDLKFFLEGLFADRRVDLVTKESIRSELRPKIFMDAIYV